MDGQSEACKLLGIPRVEFAIELRWREWGQSSRVESHFLLLFGLRPVMCLLSGGDCGGIDRRQRVMLRAKPGPNSALFMQSRIAHF